MDGRRRLAQLVLALSLLGVLASGCRMLEGAPETMTSEELGELGMARARKANAMSDGFPLEVPVHEGEVTHAKGTPSEDVWIYEMDASRSLEAVAEWYLWAFRASGWDVISDTGPIQGGARRITFRKNAAEAGVMLEPGADAEKSLVRGIVGLGQPITGRL